MWAQRGRLASRLASGSTWFDCPWVRNPMQQLRWLVHPPRWAWTRSKGSNSWQGRCKLSALADPAGRRAPADCRFASSAGHVCVCLCAHVYALRILPCAVWLLGSAPSPSSVSRHGRACTLRRRDACPRRGLGPVGQQRCAGLACPSSHGLGLGCSVCSWGV